MTDAEGRRLAEDVQRFGLLSAAAIVDRYRELVDQAMGEIDPDETMQGGLERVDPSWLVDRASRLAGGYLRFLDNATAAMGTRSASPGVERVAMTWPGHGDPAEGVIWIHNPTSAPFDDVELISTPLLSANSAMIPADRVGFRRIAAGSVMPNDSAEIRVVVSPPSDTKPGRYIGLAHLDGLDDEPIAIDLEVLAR